MILILYTIKYLLYTINFDFLQHLQEHVFDIITNNIYITNKTSNIVKCGTSYTNVFTKSNSEESK